MSSESAACIGLLLDGPMQSWGYESRYERRATALHPTRSGLLGLIAAAIGIDKHASDETARLAAMADLRVSTYALPRRSSQGDELPIVRLEDYHTVTGIRLASGKVDDERTVQTYRHYLLDARFGVLIEGQPSLLGELAVALRNPCWGVWLGRKCCPPASPLLASGPTSAEIAWRELLCRAGYTGEEERFSFDHVVESDAAQPGSELFADAPLGFGRPLGERHGPRWIRRVPRQRHPES